MTTVETIITLVLSIAVTLASTGLTVTYGVLSPWWNHLTGRGFFTVLVSLSMVLWLTILQLVWVYPLWVVWLAWSLMLVALLVMWWIIGRQQLRGSRHRVVWRQVKRKLKKDK